MHRKGRFISISDLKLKMGVFMAAYPLGKPYSVELGKSIERRLV